MFSHLFRNSSIKLEFEQKDGVNGIKLYIATATYKRKCPMLVLSLINKQFIVLSQSFCHRASPKKSRSKMVQDAYLFIFLKETHCIVDIQNNYK